MENGSENVTPLRPGKPLLNQTSAQNQCSARIDKCPNNREKLKSRVKIARNEHPKKSYTITSPEIPEIAVFSSWRANPPFTSWSVGRRGGGGVSGERVRDRDLELSLRKKLYIYLQSVHEYEIRSSWNREFSLNSRRNLDLTKYFRKFADFLRLLFPKVGLRAKGTKASPWGAFDRDFPSWERERERERASERARERESRVSWTPSTCHTGYLFWSWARWECIVNVFALPKTSTDGFQTKFWVRVRKCISGTRTCRDHPLTHSLTVCRT